MTKMEISQKKLTLLAILELSEQANLLKNHITRLSITITDEYLPWCTARCANIIPDSLEIPDMQGTKRKLDPSSTMQSKKPKHILELSSKTVKVQQGKKLVLPFLPNKRTRASTKLLGEVSKSKLNQTTVSMILDDDNDSMPSATNVSVADSETESDDHTHFNSLLSLSKHIEATPGSYASGSEKTLLTESSTSRDLTMRRAMVSSVEEDMDFDFSFLGSEPSQPVFSFTPSGLELATANASLRHFLNMNLSTLGTMEKATVLSAASILKSSPKFSQSSVLSIQALDSMFTSFQDSSSTCSKTLIQVANFKAQKEKLDDMLLYRKTLLSTLQQKTKDFDAKEELVKKLETELAQHKSDMMTLLHDNEVLKISFDDLKLDIQSLGNELVNQKEAYRQWEDTLKKAEKTRADCHSKWEELRKLDLS